MLAFRHGSRRWRLGPVEEGPDRVRESARAGRMLDHNAETRAPPRAEDPVPFDTESFVRSSAFKPLHGDAAAIAAAAQALGVSADAAFSANTANGTPQPLGLAVVASLLKSVDRVPHEALEFLDLGFPLGHGRVVPGPLPNQGVRRAVLVE